MILLLFALLSSSSGFAQGEPCESHLVSRRQAMQWLRAIDVNESNYDLSPEYEFLLQQTQLKLKAYGMSSRRRKKKLEDKARNVIEITELEPRNVNAKIIARARERFGLRVFIDPVMRRLDEGRGSTEAPDAPTVFLDFLEVQRHFETANLILLHEIRHIFFSARTAAGRGHHFQGEMIAEDGYRFERVGFYEDEISWEEVSNYYRDTRIDQRRFANGELSRDAWLQDVRHLRRISKMVVTQLNLVDPNISPRELFTEPGETFDGVVLVWPVLRGQNKLFYVHLDFPGVRRRTAVRDLRAEAWRKIAKMVDEAEKAFAYADAQLVALQKSSPDNWR